MTHPAPGFSDTPKPGYLVRESVLRDRLRAEVKRQGSYANLAMIIKGGPARGRLNEYANGIHRISHPAVLKFLGVTRIGHGAASSYRWTDG